MSFNWNEFVWVCMWQFAKLESHQKLDIVWTLLIEWNCFIIHHNIFSLVRGYKITEKFIIGYANPPVSLNWENKLNHKCGFQYSHSN